MRDALELGSSLREPQRLRLMSRMLPLEVSMPFFSCLRNAGLFAILISLGAISASAQEIKTVFVIAMENHNWTQPAQVPAKIQQIFQNPNAPFINSLVDGSAFALVNGSVVNVG